MLSWRELRRYGRPTMSASSSRIRSKFSPMWREHSSTSIMSGHMFLYVYLLLVLATSYDLIFRNIEKTCSNDIMDSPSIFLIDFIAMNLWNVWAKYRMIKPQWKSRRAHPMYLEHCQSPFPSEFSSFLSEICRVRIWVIYLSSSFDFQFQTLEVEFSYQARPIWHELFSQLPTSGHVCTTWGFFYTPYRLGPDLSIVCAIWYSFNGLKNLISTPQQIQLSVFQSLRKDLEMMPTGETWVRGPGLDWVWSGRAI